MAAGDGPLLMYGRQDLEHGSVSAVNLYGAPQAFERPGRTLASLKAELGDERVDLLELDVEGSEYDVLAATDLRALGVRVLCVELHRLGPGPPGDRARGAPPGPGLHARAPRGSDRLHLHGAALTPRARSMSSRNALHGAA